MSGSVALQFFLQDENWSPNDLDIYVPFGHFTRVCDTISSPNGFGFTRVQPDSRTSKKPPSAVIGKKGIRLVHRYASPTGHEVDVIQSNIENPTTPLQYFWTTLLANMLTPNCCVCAFPHATFRRRGLVRCGRLSDGDQTAIEKYEGRNFTFVRDTWENAIVDGKSWDGVYFGDIDAFVMDYRTRLDEKPPIMPIYRTDRGWHLRIPYPLAVRVPLYPCTALLLIPHTECLILLLWSRCLPILTGILVRCSQCSGRRVGYVYLASRIPRSQNRSGLSFLTGAGSLCFFHVISYIVLLGNHTIFSPSSSVVVM